MTDDFKQGDRINVSQQGRYKARLITDSDGYEVLPINAIMRKAGLNAIAEIINLLPRHGEKDYYHVYLDFDATREGVICDPVIKNDNAAKICLYEDYYDLRIEDDIIKVKLGQIFPSYPNTIKEFVTPDTNLKTPIKLPNGMWAGYRDYEIPMSALNAIAIPDYVTGDKQDNGFYFGVQFTGQGRF